MKYTRIKISRGNYSDANCTCGALIGTDFDERYHFTDINEAYRKAAYYNDRRNCGCKVEVREVLE